MKVIQGIGIIMGANIGTSITGWILCLSDIEGAGGVASLLSSASIAAIVAIIGLAFKSFSKKDSYKSVGDILFGFTILMLGMSTMKSAMAPLSDSEAFKGMLTKFSNPFLGILVGIIITAILQSASASVGILQSVAMSGYLPFSAALPIVMGIGVGAACPVLISGMNSNKNGKRTALVYLINDLFGMIICSILFYSIQAIVMKGGQFEFMTFEMNSVLIALLNTVYRIITIMFLAPFIKQINSLVFWLIKDTEEDVEDQADFDRLEERFLRNPELALEQVHIVINGMAKKSHKNVRRAFKLLEEFTIEKYNKIQEKENIIDKYEDKLGSYLMRISAYNLSDAQTRKSSKFLHTVSDFERIADHACGLSKVAKELNDKSMSFSPAAEEELKILYAATRELLDITMNSFRKDDLEGAHQVEPLRITVKALCTQLKKNHISRLQTGDCNIISGFTFNDLLTNIERIPAHCSNIAVAMIEFEQDDFNSHEYLKDLRNNSDSELNQLFDYYAEKYSLQNENAEYEDTDIDYAEPEEILAELEAENQEGEAPETAISGTSTSESDNLEDAVSETDISESDS